MPGTSKMVGGSWISGRSLIAGRRLMVGRSWISGRSLMAGRRLMEVVRKVEEVPKVVEAVEGRLCLLEVLLLCISRYPTFVLFGQNALRFASLSATQP